MAKNGTSYTRKGGIYHPLTNTQQVMNPDGTRLEQRLQDEEQAVRGKGEKASAHEYPMRYLGNYGSITALNAALNEIFHTTDPHWQGCLRAHMSGQVIFVSQMALNFSIGDWAQVVTGMVAPSQDGTVLVRSNTPGIYWRSRETQGETVVRHQWQSLSSIVLKTVNGQSLIGGGDITISAGGTVPIDDELDETSQNAIANAAVAKAVGELWDAIDALPDAAEGGVLVCKKWGNDYVAFSEGDYAYDPLQAAMYKYTSGAWEYQGYPKEGVIYINAPAQSSHYWDGTAMARLLGEAPLSAVNVNSSAPVNSKAVADYVEKERKVVKLTYWGNLTQDANIGEYGYDTNDNQIYLFTDSVDPQGSWVSIGTPKEDLLYLREELSTYYHYDGDEMIAMLDADKMVSSIPETGGTSVFPTAAGVKDYVDGKDTAMKTYVDNAVANIEPSGESPTAKGFGTDNYGNPLFPEYYLPVTFEGETALLGELYNSDDPDARAAAEEYIANIKWGIPFYEWPLRCYNGSNTYDAYETNASSIEVIAPSERIMHKYGITMDATTDNVVFDSVLKSFVLVYNGHVYKRWANDYEWNDISDLDNIKARKDCVFSDISLEDREGEAGTQTVNYDWRPSATGQSKRISSIYDTYENTLVDITTLMTDFTKAVHDCLASENGKKWGDMHLSDRIYYCGSCNKWYSTDSEYENTSCKVAIHNDSNIHEVVRHYQLPSSKFQYDTNTVNAFDNGSNFIVDGGQGVLFVRSYTMNTPWAKNWSYASVFSLYGASDCVFRNLTLRTLRDRDNGIDTGGNPLSSSDSCMDGFYVGGSTHDVLIENVDLQGFNNDFNIHSCNRITVNKWKSREGWQNVIDDGGKNIYFNDCEYLQRDWAGAGMHMFYYQTNAQNIMYSRCKLQMGKYSNAGLDLAAGNIAESAVPRNIHFENCELLGSSIFTGSGIGSTWVYIHGCHIKQIYAQGTEPSGLTSPYAVSVKKTKWSFSNCLFSLINAMAGGDDSGSRFEVVDCSVSSENATYLVSLSYAKCYVDKLQSSIPFKSNSTNVFGSITDENINDKVNGAMLEWKTSKDETISNLSETLYGDGNGANYVCPDEDSKPVNAAVDETCFVTSSEKKYKCTKAAVRTRITLYFYIPDALMLSDEITNLEFTLPIVGNRTQEHVTESVTMTLSVGQQSSVDATTIKTAVSAMAQTYLASADYAYSVLRESHSNGYSNVYLIIRAKTYGDAYLEHKSNNYVYVVGSSDNLSGINISARIGSSSYGTNYIAYSQPTWDELPTGESDGIVSRVTSIESKVKPGLPIAGRSADRPDPAEVGPGYCYFDLQLGTSGKAIFSTGSGWVLADGSDPDS